MADALPTNSNVPTMATTTPIEASNRRSIRPNGRNRAFGL